MPRTFITDRGDHGRRLDQAILRHLGEVPRISRTRVQHWIDEGLVTVDERPARRASAAPPVGATVAVGGEEVMVERARPQAEAQDLAILYEDDALLALDKPPGVVVHPSYKHAAGTLFNGVLGYLGADPADPDAPRLLHRLDKDTSGVLLVSKSLAVHRVAQRAMTSGQAAKTYLAVVHGRPKPHEGTITLALGVDPSDRRRVAVREDGSTSETRYVVRARGEAASLVECRLITGRMHQIRVHLAARGWPIVGDQVYGRGGDFFGRQALHAWCLVLPHPVTRHALELRAPLPPDMERLCESRGLPVPPAGAPTARP